MSACLRGFLALPPCVPCLTCFHAGLNTEAYRAEVPCLATCVCDCPVYMLGLPYLSALPFPPITGIPSWPCVPALPSPPACYFLSACLSAVACLPACLAQPVCWHCVLALMNVLVLLQRPMSLRALHYVLACVWCAAPLLPALTQMFVCVPACLSSPASLPTCFTLNP